MKKNKNNVKSNSETIMISRAEYENLTSQNRSLKEKNEKLSALNNHLWEQISLAKRKQFGASSEKVDDQILEQFSFLFNEPEVFAEEETTESTVKIATGSKDDVKKKPAQKKSGAAKDIFTGNMEKEMVEHGLSPEECTCPHCQSEMTVIGRDIHQEMRTIPAKHYLHEDHYLTYACKCCEKEGTSTPILKTPRKNYVIPGSFASAETIAYLMHQKFVMYAPLYRQELDFKRQGVQLSRQTMSNWTLKATNDWLNPIYEALKTELLQNQVLHADETTLQVLHEPGKSATSKSYMWLFRTSGDEKNPAVIYEYQPDRKSAHPKEFLKDFHGYLHCDGYSGYHNLPQTIEIVGCWAHARRNFEQALKSLPKGKQSGTSAAKGLAYCQKLFKIEEDLAELSTEERYKMRLERSKSVLDELFAWANTREAAPKSLLGKALTYLKNQEAFLRNFLDDGRLELSNNRAERSIKPFVMGRKNFLFANTPKGAQGSAVMYSIIETAKENGLDPCKYLVYIFKTAPNSDQSVDNWVDELLPWNAPEYCKVPV